ncbi:MAG: purine-nucleoside phosphorylase [Pseudomonadota bacterium]
MNLYKSIDAKVAEAAAYIRSSFNPVPQAGVILGTGLGGFASGLNIDREIDYKDIPCFPVSTVESHSGRLLFGSLSKKQVIVMKGRVHLYEGYSAQDVSFPVRVMQSLGVKTLFVSNAAGGLNPDFAAGDIMIISDHINLTGANPLIGPNIDAWGPRFPDMTSVYDKGLMQLALTACAAKNVKAHKGVYVGIRGPSLETPAETRFLRMTGADAVGFSTVCEVIAAAHAGMKILGISVITNINSQDQPVATSVDEIIAVANGRASVVESIISDVLMAL